MHAVEESYSFGLSLRSIFAFCHMSAISLANVIRSFLVIFSISKGEATEGFEGKLVIFCCASITTAVEGYMLSQVSAKSICPSIPVFHKKRMFVFRCFTHDHS